jgi:hypothetical protein
MTSLNHPNIAAIYGIAACPETSWERQATRRKSDVQTGAQ